MLYVNRLNIETLVQRGLPKQNGRFGINLLATMQNFLPMTPIESSMLRAFALAKYINDRLAVENYS